METLAFRELAPGGALAGRVECFWTLRGTVPRATPGQNRVLPDGCMDLIFDFADPPLPASGPPPPPRSYVVGAMLRPAVVRHTGTVDLLGVRFRPGAAAPWVPIRAGEIVDRVLPLEEVWKRSGVELEARLQEAEVQDRLPLLRSTLARRIPGGPDRPPTVAQALELIASTRGRITVREIGCSLAVSPRHLERLFDERVGLGPKAACRVERFRQVLRRLRSGATPSWARLALECGYYDQAHLNREFRALSGLTPTAWVAERDDVASVQYEDSPGA